MKSLTDQQLLADYAKHRTEAAFNELVRRHLDVVHSAALRMVSDPHLAEDDSQGAFMALAENAGKLAKHPVLAGWLHCTSRNLAAIAIRTDARRRLREQEAASMNEVLSATPDPSWEQIAPHLDAALGELAEPDRDAVLLGRARWPPRCWKHPIPTPVCSPFGPTCASRPYEHDASHTRRIDRPWTGARPLAGLAHPSQRSGPCRS